MVPLISHILAIGIRNFKNVNKLLSFFFSGEFLGLHLVPASFSGEHLTVKVLMANHLLSLTGLQSVDCLTCRTGWDTSTVIATKQVNRTSRRCYKIFSVFRCYACVFVTYRENSLIMKPNLTAKIGKWRKIVL